MVKSIYPNLRFSFLCSANLDKALLAPTTNPKDFQISSLICPVHYTAWLKERLFHFLPLPGVPGVEGLSRMEIDARFRYYFQHPWSRLIVAYLVTFFNFLIFAEDPVSHSQTEARMIVVGNCFSFLFNKYPGLGWNVLKVLCWILAIIIGLLAGKFIFHRQLFGKSRAQSSSSDDDDEEAFTRPCYSCSSSPMKSTGVKSRHM